MGSIMEPYGSVSQSRRWVRGRPDLRSSRYQADRQRDTANLPATKGRKGTQREPFVFLVNPCVLCPSSGRLRTVLVVRIFSDSQTGTTASLAGKRLFLFARTYCGGEREATPGLHFNRGFQRFTGHRPVIHGFGATVPGGEAEGVTTGLAKAVGAFAVGLQIKCFLSNDGEENLVAVKAPATEHRPDANRPERGEQLAGMFDEFGQRAGHGLRNLQPPADFQRQHRLVHGISSILFSVSVLIYVTGNSFGLD